MADVPKQIAEAMLDAVDGKYSAVAISGFVTDLMVRQYPEVAAGKREQIALAVKEILANAADPSVIVADLSSLLHAIKPERMRGPVWFAELQAWGQASVVFDNGVRHRKRIRSGLTAKAETGVPLARLTLISAPGPDLQHDPDAVPYKGIDKAVEEREALMMAKLPLGGSRIGGFPDLPAEHMWPTSAGKRLPFVAQFQLGALPPCEGVALPADGHLYVFADYTGDVDERGRFGTCHLFLHRGPAAELIRDESSPFRHYRREDDLVEIYEVFPVDTFDPSPVDEDAPYESDGPKTVGWLFGMPADVYDLSPGECADLQLQDGDDWIHLLAVPSVGTMQWSDCGDLYFLIRRSALEKLDFSNVLMVIGSS